MWKYYGIWTKICAAIIADGNNEFRVWETWKDYLLNKSYCKLLIWLAKEICLAVDVVHKFRMQERKVLFMTRQIQTSWWMRLRTCMQTRFWSCGKICNDVTKICWGSNGTVQEKSPALPCKWGRLFYVNHHKRNYNFDVSIILIFCSEITIDHTSLITHFIFHSFFFLLTSKNWQS